jgi:hypothetical protein
LEDVPSSKRGTSDADNYIVRYDLDSERELIHVRSALVAALTGMPAPTIQIGHLRDPLDSDDASNPKEIGDRHRARRRERWTGRPFGRRIEIGARITSEQAGKHLSDNPPP